MVVLPGGCDWGDERWRRRGGGCGGSRAAGLRLRLLGERLLGVWWGSGLRVRDGCLDARRKCSGCLRTVVHRSINWGGI